VVIEHNLDVIKTADYIIDLGPEGGGKGGYVVAKGKPEDVVKVKESYTGHFLDPILKKAVDKGDSKAGGKVKAKKKKQDN
jgi:excinuclease ABC subunit A